MKALKDSRILTSASSVEPRTIPLLIPAGRVGYAHHPSTFRFRALVAVAFVLLTIVSTAHAKYSGGTADDPYQIATVADLILLGDSPEDYDKHFILTADIDLTDYTRASLNMIGTFTRNFRENGNSCRSRDKILISLFFDCTYLNRLRSCRVRSCSQEPARTRLWRQLFLQGKRI